MRGAKTLSSLAVEVFIEEERIPPDRVLLEAGWRSSSAIATLLVPLDVFGECVGAIKQPSKIVGGFWQFLRAFSTGRVEGGPEHCHWASGQSADRRANSLNREGSNSEADSQP